VTNLSNGRTIILRVNDRGPFVGTRLIDVSRRGAQLLGFQKQGVTKVRIQAVDENGRLPRGSRRTARVVPKVPVPAVVKRVPVKTERKPAIQYFTHYIQVGSFSQQSNALLQVKKLWKIGHRARAVEAVGNAGAFWRVRVGPFVERLIAEQRLDRIVSGGFFEARIFSEALD